MVQKGCEQIFGNKSFRKKALFYEASWAQDRQERWPNLRRLSY